MYPAAPIGIAARLRVKVCSASSSRLKIEPAARASRRDSEPYFCFRFGIMVDGAYSYFWINFVPLEQYGCLNVSNDRSCLVFLMAHLTEFEVEQRRELGSDSLHRAIVG